jgi:uncharacterized membrane protein
MTLVLALLLGPIAGLRSMTPPAAVAWAAWLDRLDLGTTPLAFLATRTASYVFAGLALAELVADKLPFTPNRTAVGPFLGRILTGGLSGAGLTAGTGHSLALGALFGADGAIAGTFGGHRARTGLVKAVGVRDRAVGLAEDAVAIGGAALIVLVARH